MIKIVQMDLFDETWVFLTGAFFAAGLWYLWSKFFMLKKRPTHAMIMWQRSTLLLLSGTTALIAVLLYAAINFIFFTGQDVPIQLIIWALPFGLALSLAGYSYYVQSERFIANLMIIPGLLLGLLASNNWWHYYPNFASIFASDPAASSTAVTIQSHTHTKTPLESYYQPLPNTPKKGKIEALSIKNHGSFEPRSGYIYLPPALHSNTSLRLPVLVLLAGYPGQPTDWLNHGLQTMLDTYANAHQGLAPIVVGVDFTGVHDTDTECVNSELGDVETYLTSVVPRYLKQHYQVSLDPSQWAIGGLSAGGTCGTTIAVRNPDVYRTYLNISGNSHPSLNTEQQTLSVLFNGSKTQQQAHDPTYLLEKNKNPSYRYLNAWYFIANHDPAGDIADIKKQVAAAEKAGVTTEYHEVAGTHGFYVWKQGLEQALPWLMRIDAISSK